MTSPFSGRPRSAIARRSSKPLLVEVSKHLESEAGRLGSSCLLLSTFQSAEYFTPATAGRYEMLALGVGFVGVFGRGLCSEPVPGVRGADISEGDPLLAEWDIVVLSPHFACALLAREAETGDPARPEPDRVFDFLLTYERETVETAARTLMSRIRALATFAGPPDASHYHDINSELAVTTSDSCQI